ncbi:MAG TPA: coproporphyrinogen-III oxidase family protein, partial [Rickettsiales bacterium]|nr:coproporphyrinogen-III oxidase family protein [Rickettsiales bacterium]
GGTPSLMPSYFVDKILAKISEKFTIDENCEITLEANPTSFESEKFQEFKKSGINRLSIGVQALNDEDLKFLGRQHSAKEAIKTIENAHKIFDNFSFDLIYARPKQNLAEWRKELELALSFDTKHLSLYQLTIEKGTQFFSDFKQKKFAMPNDKLSAEFYEMTNKIMAKNDFINYEISNYCQKNPVWDGDPRKAGRDSCRVKNYQCQHNLVYWQGLDYAGIGAGAHSRIYFDNVQNRKNIIMISEPNLWLKKVQENKNGIQKIIEISKYELLEELILMGLRLDDGIDDKIFLLHFDKKIYEMIDLKKLQNLQDKGLLEISNNKLRITKKGKIISNAIISKVCEAINITNNLLRDQ